MALEFKQLELQLELSSSLTNLRQDKRLRANKPFSLPLHRESESANFLIKPTSILLQSHCYA